MLIHREALELAKMAAQDDDGGRFSLSCLMVEADGHVVVCDGVQLIRVAGKVDEPSLFDSLIPAEEREAEEPILLPAEAAMSFNAALKKRKKKKGEIPPHIVLSTEDTAIRLASSDGKVTRRFEVQPPELPYPSYDVILEQSRKRAVAKSSTFDVDVLMQVLRTLKAAGCGALTLDFAHGDGAPVRVHGFSAVMGPVEGVVMPMRTGEVEEESAA